MLAPLSNSQEVGRTYSGEQSGLVPASVMTPAPVAALNV
jgi:hypothetical protein